MVHLNHDKKYNDKSRGIIPGKYFGHDTSNDKLLNRLETFLKRPKHNTKTEWLIPFYNKIPIEKIMNFLKEKYGSK